MPSYHRKASRAGNGNKRIDSCCKIRTNLLYVYGFYPKRLFSLVRVLLSISVFMCYYYGRKKSTHTTKIQKSTTLETENGPRGEKCNKGSNKDEQLTAILLHSLPCRACTLRVVSAFFIEMDRLLVLVLRCFRCRGIAGSQISDQRKKEIRKKAKLFFGTVARKMLISQVLPKFRGKNNNKQNKQTKPQQNPGVTVTWF